MTQRQRVLILREKRCDRFFDVATDDDLHQVALSVLRQRFGPDGELRHDLVEDAARLIDDCLLRNNGRLAWSILRERSRREYESVELVELSAAEAPRPDVEDQSEKPPC